MWRAVTGGELPFNPDTSAGAETECVSMFRYEAHVRPSSVQSGDYTFKVPDWPGMYEQQGESLNGQLEQYEIFDYPGRYRMNSTARISRCTGWRACAVMRKRPQGRVIRRSCGRERGLR